MITILLVLTLVKCGKSILNNKMSSLKWLYWKKRLKINQQTSMLRSQKTMIRQQKINPQNGNGKNNEQILMKQNTESSEADPHKQSRDH